MAKKVKTETESETVDASKRLPIKRYYAKYLNYAFDVDVVDDNGEVKVKQNNQGNNVLDSEGNTIPIHKMLKFTNVHERVSQGYLSRYDFDPNDTSAQNVVIGKRLEQLDADQGVSVECEDKFEKRTNAAAYSEKQKRKELESEIEKLKTEKAEQAAQYDNPDFLEKRLAEVLGK